MKLEELTQAQQEFLNTITTTKTYLRKSDMTSGDAFSITITYNNKTIGYTFNANIYNDSDKNDLIWCLLMDAGAYAYTIGLTAFMTEFGYEDKEQATKIYKACEEQHKRLHKLFTREEIEMLEEIYQDY